MNETLNSQLAAPHWQIPQYARDLLWVESASGGDWASGERGQFSLKAPSPWVTVRWGGAEGPILAWRPWQHETLGWDGAVGVGGYLDSMHVTEIAGLDFPIMVFCLAGQPIKHDWSPYPIAEQRKQVPYTMPDFFGGLAVEAQETTTTWLAPEPSAFATIAQDALVNNLRLFCQGHLAEDAGGWAKHFALPILLESVTLFSP